MLRTVLVLALCACHGPALPAIPGKGGPAWIELQSDHFTLWTDSSRSRAQTLIRQLEHFRQVVLGVGFSGSRADGRSLVLALRDSEEVGVFIPEQFVAMASSGGALRQPMIVLPADANRDQAEVVTHELAHVISFNVIRHQPHWFAEGLANFFATVDLDPDRATGKIGEPRKDVVGLLKTTPPLPSARLFGCREHACMDDLFYATAWALFTFLANTRPQDLLRYAEVLDGLPGEPDAQVEAKVWAALFPDLTPDAIDHELRKWLSYGRHTVWTFNVKLEKHEATERKLGDGDVLAARAVLRQLMAKDGAGPPAELGEALAADPTQLLAHLVATQYKQPLTVDQAQKVADAHGDDWRAWWLVARASDFSGEDAHAAWQRACALLAKQPSAAVSADWCVEH